ncbi:hypothetical protein ACHAWF_009240 [Thalassiosira exigua]
MAGPKKSTAKKPGRKATATTTATTGASGGAAVKPEPGSGGKAATLRPPPPPAAAAGSSAKAKEISYPLRTLPSLRSPSSSSGASLIAAGEVGRVRATPPGHMLDGASASSSARAARETWHKVRSDPAKVGTHPREGFAHVLGSKQARDVDGVPVGGRVEGVDAPRGPEDLDEHEEAALRAELAMRRAYLAEAEGELDESAGGGGGGGGKTDGHEYGASRSPLDAPIGSLREKWRVLPHFLKLRGLMKQHIDSFDHFVRVEMRQIVQVREDEDRDEWIDGVVAKRATEPTTEAGGEYLSGGRPRTPERVEGHKANGAGGGSEEASVGGGG